MHLSCFALQVAFDGIGSMPMARIENYRQVKQEAVEFEMKRRNARKNLDHALITSPEASKTMQVEGKIGIKTSMLCSTSLILLLLESTSNSDSEIVA